MAGSVEYAQKLESMKDYMKSRFLPSEKREELLYKMGALSETATENYPEICSIITVGSLTRDDFVLGASDFDIVAVFYEKPSMESLDYIQSKAEKEFPLFKNTSHGKWAYDIQSIELDQIPLEYKNPYVFCPLGIFNYRAFDTKEFGRVLCGEDILKDLVVRDPKPDSPSRIGRLLLKYYDCPSQDTLEKDTWKIIHTGDIIKAAQIYFGKRSYHKIDVLEGFIKRVPEFENKEFIFDFFGEYLNPHYFRKHSRADFMKKQEDFLSELLSHFRITPIIPLSR